MYQSRDLVNSYIYFIESKLTRCRMAALMSFLIVCGRPSMMRTASLHLSVAVLERPGAPNIKRIRHLY